VSTVDRLSMRLSMYVVRCPIMLEIVYCVETCTRHTVDTDGR
jgi:hypothetical protein